MLYREAGQFKTSYAADQQLFPIRQDRIGLIVLLPIGFTSLYVSYRNIFPFPNELAASQSGAKPPLA